MHHECVRTFLDLDLMKVKPLNQTEQINENIAIRSQEVQIER